MTSPRTAEPITFSQSSLQDFSDCPRRFQLRYLQELIWPAVEAEPLSEVERRQREGQFFHRLVQQHFLGIPSPALAAMASSPDLMRWWENFASSGPDLDGWNTYTEKALTSRIASDRLLCKYDVVAVRDGKARIYDWKTYARRPSNEWLAARMQTRVYRAMLIKAGAELNGGRPFAPEDVSMIYWFAEYPTESTTLNYDRQQYARDWEYLEKTVEQAAGAQSFPLTENLDHCRFCNYRSLCDRGRQPGTDADYESIAAAWMADDGSELVSDSSA